MIDLYEYLGDEGRAALDRVLRAEDFRFNRLVDLSGLRPDSDFRFCDLREIDLRGADLRGFDLTGADLRGCLRDSQTLIDESTILEDAVEDWIEADKASIVSKMLQIESSPTSSERRKHLIELVNDYQSPNHIRQYVCNLIERSQSIESLFDYANVIVEPDPRTADLIKRHLIRLLMQRSRVSRQQKREVGSRLLLDDVIDKLKSSPNQALQQIYDHYLEKRYDSAKMSFDPSRYEITGQLSELIAAIQQEL